MDISMETIKISSGAQLPKNFTGIVEYPHNTKIWYKNGSIHRKGGPAYIHSEINPFRYDLIAQRWYKNGILHRIDGPACEHSYYGFKEWYINGKHPIDRPAQLRNEGFYWFYEKRYWHVGDLIYLFDKGIFLGGEKRKYGITCFLFLTEHNGVREFPIMGGMKQELRNLWKFDLVSKLEEYKL